MKLVYISIVCVLIFSIYQQISASRITFTNDSDYALIAVANGYEAAIIYPDEKTTLGSDQTLTLKLYVPIVPCIDQKNKQTKPIKPENIRFMLMYKLIEREPGKDVAVKFSQLDKRVQRFAKSRRFYLSALDIEEFYELLHQKCPVKLPEKRYGQDVSRQQFYPVDIAVLS